MTKTKLTDVLTKIVEILTPISSDERKRVIDAALTLLGDTTTKSSHDSTHAHDDTSDGADHFPPIVHKWINQNKLSEDEIDQVFHVAEGTANLITPKVPGKNDKERTLNVYVLAGVAAFIVSGKGHFADKTAVDSCKALGCHNSANHATYLKSHGNEFTGSKHKGWTLTVPGLKRGAELIKEICKPEK